MGTYEIAPWLHYKCIQCGLCCKRGFSIWCPKQDRARLEKVDWAGKYPHLEGKALFHPHRSHYRFAIGEDGCCVFLDPNNGCLQHNELGYDAKVITCKMFPVTMTHSFGRVHAGLLFSCPAVVDDAGPPLSKQIPLLDKLRKELDSLFDPPPFTEETALDMQRTISFRNLRFLEEALIEAMGDEEMPLLRRVLCAGDLLDRLDASDAEQLDEKHFHETLCHHRERAREHALNCGLRRQRIGLFEGVFLRQLQAVCCSLAEHGLLSDFFLTRQKARLHRVALALRYMHGCGRLPDQEKEWRQITGPRGEAEEAEPLREIGFRDAHAVHAYHLPPESEEVLARHIRSRIAARTYFGKDGWGLGVLAGMRTVLTLPALVLWHAKVRAATVGRDALTHADIRAALLLVEHTFGHMSALHTGWAVRPLSIVNREGWPQKALLAMMLEG